MIKTNLLIIGGSDAGISAALQARQLNDQIEISIVMADSFPNFSICGLPYTLSGEVSDWRSLSHRTIDDLKKYKIDFYFDTLVTKINPKVKEVQTNEETFTYEKLIVATGMKTKTIEVEGDVSKIGYLTTMKNYFQVEENLTKTSIKKIAVIGAGYVGIESAEALSKKGFEVTLITKSNQVLSTIDSNLAEIVERRLIDNNIKVILNNPQEKIDTENFDFILVSIGIKPNSKLLIDAGAEFDSKTKAIKVNDEMETNLKDVYAAGDLVLTKHKLLGFSYTPLGTTAHKQGRIAGANAVGAAMKFAGSIGTQVIRIFDLIVTRTGLSLSQALENGYNAVQAIIEVDDHKAYIPGSKKITIKLIADLNSKKILGAQLLGSTTSEIAKRTDIFATAIFNQMTLESFLSLDLTYSPVVGSPWDAVQQAVQKLELEINSKAGI